MELDLTVIDSFTDRPFAGNPAAVAVVDAFLEDSLMQLVAREMNLSETAFVVHRDDGSYDLRWFTPSTEVDLCGHATLAAAHVLGGAGRFHTRGGQLECHRGEGGWIDMDFPADPPVAEAVPESLVLPDVQWFGRGRTDALVQVADVATVRALEPDLTMLGSLGGRLVMVTAPGDRRGIDCVTRVFAPNAGIAEDPATGSAHCTLAPFWASRLGRTRLVGEQASARGGIVGMEFRGDRVVLSGQAVTVSQVRMQVSA